MEGRLGRFFDRFKQKPEPPEIIENPSIEDSGPVVYTKDGMIIDPSKLPVGGQGYPIRWLGEPARVIGDGKGGFDVFEDKQQ